jgi:hypothetical protein
MPINTISKADPRSLTSWLILFAGCRRVHTITIFVATDGEGGVIDAPWMQSHTSEYPELFKSLNLWPQPMLLANSWRNHAARNH